jgi:hypothetical protein
MLAFRHAARHVSVSGLLLLTCAPVARAQVPPPLAPGYLSPQHDARIALDMRFVQERIRQLHLLTYGNQIVLERIACGKPYFLAQVQRPPEFRLAGTLNANGAYSTRISLDAGFVAEVFEQCLGINNPVVTGAVNLAGSLGPVQGLSSIPLDGKSVIDLGWINPNLPKQYSDIHANIPIPGSLLTTIPIQLTQAASGAQMDFGAIVNGQWQTAGTKRDVPLTMNVGSFGGSESDNAYLIIDATIGTQPRLKLFPRPLDALADFESDLPLWNKSHVGFSFKDSFFGGAQAGQPGIGLLGALLPVRVRGRSEPIQVLWWKEQYEYEVILDGAQVEFVPHEGADAVRATLSSTAAYVYRIKNGVASKKRKLVDRVSAVLVLDRLDAAGGELVFRVAEFKVELKTRSFLIPIKLSSGALEASLNHGSLKFGDVPDHVSGRVPECFEVGEFFNSRDGACGAPAGQKKAKHLSYIYGGKPSFFYYVQNADPPLRVEKRAIQLGFRLWSPFGAGTLSTPPAGELTPLIDAPNRRPQPD